MLPWHHNAEPMVPGYLSAKMGRKYFASMFGQVAPKRRQYSFGKTCPMMCRASFTRAASQEQDFRLLLYGGGGGGGGGQAKCLLLLRVFREQTNPHTSWLGLTETVKPQ